LHTVLDEIELAADLSLQGPSGVGQKIASQVIDHRPMLISELADAELVGNAQSQIATPEIEMDEGDPEKPCMCTITVNGAAKSRSPAPSLFAYFLSFCSSPVSNPAPQRQLERVLPVLSLIPRQQVENALMAYVQHGAV
jgi:hypothetical protein